MRHLQYLEENLMATRGYVAMEDYDKEACGTHVNLADIGFVGATYATESQNLDEIKDALILVSGARVISAQLTKEFPESPAVVTDKNFQRETKWLVRYFDNQQFLDAANTIPNPGYLKKFNFEVPCAKLALLRDGSDEMNISTGDGATFKTSIEGNYRSPTGGTITIIEVVHVGRDS
jgi:hypothetical protein